MKKYITEQSSGIDYDYRTIIEMEKEVLKELGFNTEDVHILNKQIGREKIRLNDYLEEIVSKEKLTKKDIREYIEINSKAILLRNSLVTLNIALVPSCSKDLLKILTIDEIMEYGEDGLLKASGVYDPDYRRKKENIDEDTEFSTIATTIIRQSLFNYLRRKYRDIFLKCPDKQIRNLLSIEVLTENYSRELRIPSKKEPTNTLLLLDIINSELNEKERDIIYSRFGIGKEKIETLKEIGIRYNVSKERIRNIESKILDKLKEILSKRDLYQDLALDE